ncbi:MAG: alpha/beta hydrolase family protein [Longimicrobiales bacterium]
MGVVNDTMITRLAKDMAAGVAMLREQPEIDDDRIGVGGISQAGWIVPVAAEMSDARFALILVGSTMPLGVNMRFERLNRESDSPPSELALIAAKYDGALGFDPIPVLERGAKREPTAGANAGVGGGHASAAVPARRVPRCGPAHRARPRAPPAFAVP